MKVNGDSMTNENKIKQFLDANRGYISTSDFVKLNISKPLIKKYVDKNSEIWYHLDTKTGCALEVGILGHV